MSPVKDSVSWPGSLWECDGTCRGKITVHIEQQDLVAEKAGNHHDMPVKQNLVTARLISGLNAFAKRDGVGFLPVNKDTSLMVICCVDKCVILNDVTGGRSPVGSIRQTPALPSLISGDASSPWERDKYLESGAV